MVASGPCRRARRAQLSVGSGRCLISPPARADDSGPLTTTIEDGVAVLRFDDGKANVLSHAAIDAFEAALDRAEVEARAVCIVGREGKLCAGFDLSVMTGAPRWLPASSWLGVQSCSCASTCIHSRWSWR